MNERAAYEGVAVPTRVPSASPAEVSTGSGMPELVLSHVTERSILHARNAANFEPFEVAGRKRRATCSGVAWFRGYHLAVVNLYGGHLRVYRFHPGGHVGPEPARLELLHELSEGIDFPEDVAVSPDGNLLAVTHSMSENRGVSLFPVAAASLAPGPARESIRPGKRGSAFHGLNFSPDARHLVLTEISAPGYVEVVRVASPARERTCLIENQFVPRKPKSVAFSHDGRFAVIAMGLNATRDGRTAAAGGMLSIHRFDAANGVIVARALAELPGTGTSLANVEGCTFLPTTPGKPYHMLVADQGADAIRSFEFDAQERTITSTGIFAAGLSFPHGLDVSADGRFVAIANYGDDTLRIARVPPSVGGVGERSTV